MSDAPYASPDRLGAGIDKDRPDYTVYSDGGAIRPIYETRGGPDRSAYSLQMEYLRDNRPLVWEPALY